MDDLMEIKIELIRRRITQRALAIHLGVSETWLSDVLRSIRPVNRDFIRDMRHAMDELSSFEMETGSLAAAKRRS